MQFGSGSRAIALTLALAGSLVGGGPASAASQDVVTLGANPFGQLGNGAVGSTARPTPVKVAGGATDVAGGREHTLALVNGKVLAWGADLKGAVGDGGTFSSAVNTPTPVAGPTGVDSVTTGHYHSLALDRDADVVWAWGWNSRGQMGPAGGTGTKVGTPVKVGLPGQVSMVAAGRAHSLAIVGGVVYAWGDNGSGQLGLPADTARHATPTAVKGLPTGVTWVAGGRDSSFAIAGGKLYAWGSNNYGQLGIGSTTSRSTPALVASGVQQVESGADHTVALLTSGAVSSWGRNRYGQLGYTGSANVLRPKATGLTGVEEVRVGRDHSMAIGTSGTFYAWGRNDGGQLGVPATTTKLYRPTAISALAGAQDMGGGQVHTVVLR